MRNRLGCFSPIAIISALIVFAVIAGVILTRGYGMFNPGPLNAEAGEELGGVTSHAATGGNCESCHVSFWGEERMADRCGDCHTDMIGAMTKVAKSHTEMKRQDSNVPCADCHPEHRGADAPLTIIAATVEFPHEALGYPLSGHQLKVTQEAFVCEDCHTPEYDPYDQADCVECHRGLDEAFTQTHVVSWGEDCSSASSQRRSRKPATRSLPARATWIMLWAVAAYAAIRSVVTPDRVWVFMVQSLRLMARLSGCKLGRAP